jgi:YVTN family beta-propeller protein
VIRRFSRPVVSLALMLAGLVVGQSSSPASAVGAPECQVWVMSGTATDLTIVDSWSSEPSTLPLNGVASDLTFNRSGTKVFVAMQNSGVKLIDVATLGIATLNTGIYAAGQGSFGSIAANPTLDVVLAATHTRPFGNQNYYTLLNSETGSFLNWVPTPDAKADIAFSRNGHAFAPDFVFGQQNPSGVIDQIVTTDNGLASSSNPYPLAANEYYNSAVVADPPGQSPILFVGRTGNNNGHFLSALNTADMTVVSTTTLSASPSSLAVSQAGDLLFISQSGLNQVEVRDTITRNVITTIPVGSGPAGMAVTPDGRFLYVANWMSNTLSKIDIATLAVVETINVNSSPSKVAIGPAGCVSVQPQSTPIWRATLDPAGGECNDAGVARTTPWTSVFVGYRYLPGDSECTRDGHAFDGWAYASSPTKVAALPMLTDPSDGKKRAFVAGNLELVAVWTKLPEPPSVFVALDGFFCTNCGVFLAWNDDIDDVIVTQDVQEVCVTGVLRIGEWSLCHDPTAPRGVLTYSLVATAGSKSSEPVIASVSR